VTDIEQFWSTLKSTLGLRASVTEWDPVHATLDGLGPIDGIVDYVTPEFLACAPALACIGSSRASWRGSLSNTTTAFG